MNNNFHTLTLFIMDEQKVDKRTKLRSYSNEDQTLNESIGDSIAGVGFFVISAKAEEISKQTKKKSKSRIIR